VANGLHPIIFHDRQVSAWSLRARIHAIPFVYAVFCAEFRPVTGHHDSEVLQQAFLFHPFFDRDHQLFYP
jgi:hypothetical protein